MNKSINLDRLDHKILDALVEDGRISKAALGEKVGLSPTPCFERIKKMERAKIINGCHVSVDLSRIMDVAFILVMIEILDYTQEKAMLFQKRVSAMPEVIGAQTVMGNYDFILHIAARNIDHYQRVLQRILSLKEFEIDYRSYPVTNTFKTPSTLSLLPLIDAIQEDQNNPSLKDADVADD